MTILFCFDRTEDSDWIQFCATTANYWEEHTCLDANFRDEDLGTDIPGVANTMEASFEINPRIVSDEDNARKYLESFGLVYSPEMESYINGES